MSRLPLFYFVALLIAIATLAIADDEVRLDHKGMAAIDMPASGFAAGAMDNDSGSGDLSIKIERDGFTSEGEGDADSELGANGPLSRDGGFNFGSAD